MARGAVWLIGLAPMAWALWRGLSGGLGAQLHMPAELGTWSLRFLLATLAVAPVAALVRRPGLLGFRRDLGLIAFAYALAHVAAYVLAAEAWRWPLEAAAQRPDFIPGALALLVLIPAAVGWRRARAASLAAAPLAVLHYAMPVGFSTLAPWLYGAAAALLLAWRFGRRRPGGPAPT